MDRVVTFSLLPEDEEGWEHVQKLKKHGKDTGISFSHLMKHAMRLKVEELEL